MRALGEDRVRPERAQLARDAERQSARRKRRPRAPGGARPRRARSVASPPRAVARRRREHAEVELVAERVELALRATPIERQRVARAPDHQRRAASRRRPRLTSACSIRPSRIRGSASSLDGRRRRRGERARSPSSADDALDRGRERGGVAGRHEQAVLAVADDLRERRRPRSRSRASRRRAPRRQRVREVLPGGGEERRVGGPEEREHVVARPRAEEADAVVETPSSAARALERRPLGPVADDEQLDAGNACERLRARPRAPSAPSAGRRMPSVGPVDAEHGARAPRASGAPARPARGSGRRSRAPRGGPSRAQSRGGTRSGQTTRARATQRGRSRRAERPRTRAPPRCAWNASSVAGEATRAPLALVRLVGGELDDERPSRECRAERRAAHHARRVDDVGAAGAHGATSRTTAR